MKNQSSPKKHRAAKSMANYIQCKDIVATFRCILDRPYTQFFVVEEIGSGLITKKEEHNAVTQQAVARKINNNKRQAQVT